MTPRTGRLACIALLALSWSTAAAADEIDAPQPRLEEPLRATEVGGTPVRVIEPETLDGWGDPPGQTAIDDWSAQNPWGFGAMYVFPLTRGVVAADLPLWAKIPAYPLTGAFDLVHLPFGAIGGLWGR